MHPAPPFFGPQAVRAAFVLAMFGWGIGFYGPPIFLHTVVQRSGWSLALVSSAVTLHFVFGALTVTRLPQLHRRFGVGPTAVAGAAVTSLGLFGWATASAPWQVFVSALLSGGGWVTLGAVTVNAVVAPWYQRGRPRALGQAYNGASIGGVVFAPLWVLLIIQLGFVTAALGLGLLTVLVMALLAHTVLARSPQAMGQQPDGDAPDLSAAALPYAVDAQPLRERQPWRDRRLLTLALGMALGLFAQVGLLAHLFSLLVPVLGAQRAGWVMGFATACAIGGRSLAARLLSPRTDRRRAAAAAYAVQLLGSLLLLVVDADQTLLILLGVALFGSGIGNATSLPPLIAQHEFAQHEVARVVALIVATSQATYAFAPAIFGALLTGSSPGGAWIGDGAGALFVTVAVVQGLAMGCLLAGRRTAPEPERAPPRCG